MNETNRTKIPIGGVNPSSNGLAAVMQQTSNIAPVANNNNVNGNVNGVPGSNNANNKVNVINAPATVPGQPIMQMSDKAPITNGLAGRYSNIPNLYTTPNNYTITDGVTLI